MSLYRYMLCSNDERNKIISEIHSLSNKIAQEQYLERVKQIVQRIKDQTGIDLSEKLLPKKARV